MTKEITIKTKKHLGLRVQRMRGSQNQASWLPGLALPKAGVPGFSPQEGQLTNEEGEASEIQRIRISPPGSAGFPAVWPQAGDALTSVTAELASVQ